MNPLPALKGDPVLYHLIEATSEAGVPLTSLGWWLLFYWRGQWFEAMVKLGIKELPQHKPDDNRDPEPDEGSAPPFRQREPKPNA